MNTNMMGVFHLLSAMNTNNNNIYGTKTNNYQAGTSFYSMMQNQQINQMKQEIYKQFQINVGNSNDAFQCYIPSEVLCKMNTNKALKEKVFSMLEKYGSEDFKKSIMGQKSAIEKCSLVFDEEGDMTVTLETDKENNDKINQEKRLSYYKLLMQQTALMSSSVNLYSGYQNLYGFPYNYNTYFNGLRNSLFSSMLGNLF